MNFCNKNLYVDKNFIGFNFVSIRMLNNVYYTELPITKYNIASQDEATVMMNLVHYRKVVGAAMSKMISLIEALRKLKREKTLIDRKFQKNKVSAMISEIDSVLKDDAPVAINKIVKKNNKHQIVESHSLDVKNEKKVALIEKRLELVKEKQKLLEKARSYQEFKNDMFKDREVLICNNRKEILKKKQNIQKNYIHDTLQLHKQINQDKLQCKKESVKFFNSQRSKIEKIKQDDDYLRNLINQVSTLPVNVTSTDAVKLEYTSPPSFLVPEFTLQNLKSWYSLLDQLNDNKLLFIRVPRYLKFVFRKYQSVSYYDRKIQAPDNIKEKKLEQFTNKLIDGKNIPAIYKISHYIKEDLKDIQAQISKLLRDTIRIKTDTQVQ